jgi:hypothetical protein
MSIKKIRKAIAGGIAGASTAVAGFAWGYGEWTEQLGHVAGVAVTGFVLGFFAVYFAKANEPA